MKEKSAASSKPATKPATKGKNIIIRKFKSPCGVLILGSVGGKLCMCDWEHEKGREHMDMMMQKRLGGKFITFTSPVIMKARKELKEYFAGKRTKFTVPVVFAGTDFQNAVWREIAKVPYGKTISYGELARRVGRPEAVRAAANATGANPVSIIVPCHRIIGSDNKLVGYGGGIKVKDFLLRHEKKDTLF